MRCDLPPSPRLAFQTITGDRAKNASVNVRPGSAISNGTVAIADISTQASVTSRNPSRDRSSRLCRRVIATRAAIERLQEVLGS
jgi:hypothetical protein